MNKDKLNQIAGESTWYDEAKKRAEKRNPCTCGAKVVPISLCMENLTVTWQCTNCGMTKEVGK